MKHAVNFDLEVGSLDVETQCPQLEVTEYGANSGPRPEDAELATTVRGIIRARTDRSRILSTTLFAEPAWDILLELFASGLDQRRVTVTDLGRASGVPASTTLRWIANLLEENFVVRHHDPLDARRVFVKLSQRGFNAMREYFEFQSKVGNLKI